VLALGDGQNDIGMLRWAGLAVAMGHGVPEAKAEADYIAERPHLEPVEDGILWALEHDRTVRQDVR
jgi:hydroxymethylpyrimidine pyrophosphatase-like HAD family hydrolase